MEYRSRVVENCQLSEKCRTPQSQTFSKPRVNKRQVVSEKEMEACEETDKADVIQNPYHDGRSELNGSINETNCATSDTSLDTIIGNFCNFLKPQDKPLPSRVAVISISLEKPLFIALGIRKSPYVTATISLSK